MKKLIFTALATVIFLGSGSALAYDEQMQDGFTDPTRSRLGKVYAEKKLQDAMRQRYYNYVTEKARTNAYKNRKTQYFRHLSNRAANNTNQRASFLKRDGELKNVPYYQDRRSHSRLNTGVPNNPKRNFRIRAYDYYVEGGEAGVQALTENVVNGETHRVKRSFYGESNTHNFADIISDVREAQRSLEAPDQVPTGYQSQTYRKGDWRWNLMHPYMFRQD